MVPAAGATSKYYAKVGHGKRFFGEGGNYNRLGEEKIGS